MFGPGPLKWIYLALAVLMASAMVDMYVPLFGQRLAHLVPVAAGFLGAALAVGWTVSEIAQRVADEAGDHQRVSSIAAPLVIAVGLILTAVSQVENAPTGRRRDVGAGADDHRDRHRRGWPHLSAWAMQCVDEQEGAAAARRSTRSN